MRLIRRNTFETNSSSTHSLTMCDKNTFHDWKEGKIFYDSWDEKFVDSYYTGEEEWRNEYVQSYEEWEYDDYLETYEEEYETPGGEVIIAFGKYGFDG